jgi:hypothetical protein
VVDLATVTLRRIPLTLFKLGSWTVHIGILTLIGGFVWYFAHKEEGAVRIYLNQSADYCYDVTERALYAFPTKADGSLDSEHPQITPLPTLPIYSEHLAERGNPLDIMLPGALPGGTGSVHITGYYPCASLQPMGIRACGADESGIGPGMTIALTNGVDQIPEHWLLAYSPAMRVLQGEYPYSIEYLRHPTPQRLKDLQTSFEGSMAITVRIPKLQIERTYGVKERVAIAVEGSPYTLTPVGYHAMPLRSEGYEGAASTMLTVDVVRQDAQATYKFQRMCVFRYPELSPDFIEAPGQSQPVRKQEGVDPDIQIIFHDATQTQVWIVEGDDGTLSFIQRTSDGKSTTQPLTDKPVHIAVDDAAESQLALRVARRAENTVVDMAPVIVPVEQRQHGQTVMDVIEMSMVEAEVGQGPGKQARAYVPFSEFAAIGEPPVGRNPAMVDVPGGGRVGLLLATSRRALPSKVTLTKFEPIKYPGAQRSYADYVSTMTAQDAGSGEKRALVTHLNNPASDHGLYYFQAAWDGDDNAPPEKRFSVIGVANRPGIHVMVAGALLIVLGIGYAFYLKPILLKMKKESLAKWAKERAAGAA